MNTLGVPPSGSPEAVAFWLSFWPSFWSGAAAGVLSSLLTGLIVGYLLVHYQKGVATRSLANTYAHDLSVKLDQLRRALSQKDIINIASVEAATPVPVAAAAAVLSEMPVTLWFEALPKQRDLLSKAIELQKSHASFNVLASELEQILRQQVRAFNHQRGAIAANDLVYLNHAVGTVFGIPGVQLLPWLSSNGPEVLEAYETAWRSISSHARLAEIMPLIQRARENAKNAASALLSAIDA